MKRRDGSILAVVLLVGLLCGCTGNTASVTAAAMCTSLDDQGRNTDTVTVYPATAERLTVSAYVDGVADTTHALFVWYYETGDTQLASYDVEFSQSQYLTSYITTEAEVWPAGQYRVDVFIDSQVEPDITIPFQVEEQKVFQIDSAVLCTALNDDGSNRDIVNSFAADAGQFCVSVHLSGVGDQEIPATCVWMNLDTDETIYTQDLVIPSDQGAAAYVGSRISKDTPWESGEYGVGLKLKDAEEYLVFLHFDVTE